ncbi:MAG: hypothetical protein KJP14_09935, partial [Eudoraea sp.]|nr:hypothetical protein [Eudoraea sp.]
MLQSHMNQKEKGNTSISNLHYPIAVFLLIISSCIAQVNAQEEANACPCCTEQHKAFDFWIGNWEVFLKDGTVAGYNRIEKLQDN